MRRRGGFGSWVRGTVSVALALALAACGDDDPSGPGTLTLTVEASVPLGAAVLELRGDGLVSASPLGAGWTHLEQVAGGGSGSDVHRLVLVQQQSGMLSAELEVTDVAAPMPVVGVLLASDAADLPLASLADVEVRVRR